jgi:predicted GNAT superfamily acetyltransferase
VADPAIAGWRERQARATVLGMPDFQVRDAHGAALVDGCALLARAVEFSDRDALPPWLVQTSAGHGGLALGAFAGERLVGFSFALPAAGGELFSCGLAVAPDYRGRGVARRLKLAQRERALAQGATVIRWTADPLAAPALALYLGGLHARLVAYAPELYATVRAAPVTPDDVEIEWRLTEPPLAPGRPSARVEIPLEPDGLSVRERAHWRLGVRRAMTEALARGALGTDVALDRSGGRAWVLFSEVA